MMQTQGASRPRWLIVDDNKDILSLMSDIVSRCMDVDIQCFHSPHAALATFAAAPEAVDFVITDLEMPGMSGLELLLRAVAEALFARLAAAHARRRGHAGQPGGK